ncbi:hypothetical protein A3C67_01555 [Candidatus Nomurabacteria bacterium RIFCSPHIGHO2_02_FULL_42_19]|uniref:LTD domain-containing protein n=1 Tax=Candidatus Nomurabacteria bacterium RIFCSPHIGHO2_02_FULL_42_19 TaxID=1801756 RepID=A0A1F6W2I4_9BACT|nr:MAG: hypothetical protein A3C67_01555 [Candidatus Nomurabacteria bacterium RIFCSPHIGHO2_02_FULL_42_19]
MRKIIVILAVIFFSTPCFVLASLEISEIMYDLKTGSDDGREWVEIFNNSDSSVDFSTFKFFEGDTNHKLTLIQGDIKVGTAGYAIIVADNIKFKTDWPNFSGNIFDSSFSLSNTGEILAIKNADLVVNEFFYQSSSGGAGDGKSLQKINGAWVGAAPTPGAENKIIFTPPPAPKIVPALSQVSAKPEQSPEKIEIPAKIEVIAPILPEDNSSPNSKALLFLTIFSIFLGGSAGGVYFMRRKAIIPKIGEDFEILD